MFAELTSKPLIAFQEEMRAALRQMRSDPNIIPISSPPIGVIESGDGNVRCAYCRRIYAAIPTTECRSCGASDWIEKFHFSDGGVEVSGWQESPW